MSVLQMRGRAGLGPSARLDFAAGYYRYGDLHPSGSTSILEDNRGNHVLDLDDDGTPEAFTSEFTIVNPIVALTVSPGSRPVTLAGEYVVNLRAADGAESSGWAAGIAVGRTQAPGDYKLYYQRQVVQREAVFSPFVQDDFLFATNHRSHVFGTTLQLQGNTALNLWALASSLDEAGAPTQWRLRIDMNLKL